MIKNDCLRPELFDRRDRAAVNPLVAQLTHGKFPEAAEALRSAADDITRDWDTAVRQAMPQMRHLTVDELKDSTPQILRAIADALASDDPQAIQSLVRCAPQQGLSRLQLNFDVVEIMEEDRLLRALIVLHVETALGRRLDSPEAAALHADVDLMLQRSVIALVEAQKASLRAAAETELKFVSFLAHDMNNNLNNVNLMLSVLADDISNPETACDALASVQIAQQSIEDTALGMRRMLEHERLRKSGETPPSEPVDLHKLAALVALQITHAAAAKGVAIAINVPPGAMLESNGELITLVLQNFIGNAVKYSTGGTVRIGVDPGTGAGPGGAAAPRSVWVSDDGPGIAAARMGDIFEAFRRGEIHGLTGVGLGLAVASQAAKLLGATLNVDSAIGVGSTFRLIFPVKTRD
jgi:signal transduction histidine kinase